MSKNIDWEPLVTKYTETKSEWTGPGHFARDHHVPEQPFRNAVTRYKRRAEQEIAELSKKKLLDLTAPSLAYIRSLIKDPTADEKLKLDAAKFIVGAVFRAAPVYNMIAGDQKNVVVESVPLFGGEYRDKALKMLGDENGNGGVTGSSGDDVQDADFSEVEPGEGQRGNEQEGDEPVD